MGTFWLMFGANKEPVADIFYEDPFGIQDSKILSLVYYFTGYTKGMIDLKDKVLAVRDELVEAGYKLPEIKL